MGDQNKMGSCDDPSFSKLENLFFISSITKGIFKLTPAAEGHGLWPWMNAPTSGRDVAPLWRYSGATGYARGARHFKRDITQFTEPIGVDIVK